MSIPTAAKVAFGLGAAGAIGGGALLSKPYLFPDKPTLRSVIEGDKWKLLTSSDEEKIKTVLEAYKKQSTHPFTNFTGSETNASSKLLGECKKLYEKPEDTPDRESSLKKLKRWCVIPKTASERLSDLNVTPFSVADPTTENNEDSKWVEKSKKHTDGSKDKFEGLTFSGNADHEKAKQLRTHCKTKLDTKSFEDSFDDILKKVEIWCSPDK
ncbi:hypothetical protein MHF_1414 [Mycoplasma haemofelis Ohio2]|uniref:Uncharacterized protein n=1 Tax=Mycoplasma haemofelis (strain Ohio2) TaxID=859194 RepID=F6FGL0_MYCHI|nr:hypothetical protein MHF_1414 [Mycoplasma haemofelis Ohio2]